jgi:hypothetical protein
MHATIQQSSNSREQFTSHAYTECGHDAQCFALLNFDATRHDDLIRRAHEDARHAKAAAEEAIQEGFETMKVRRPLACRTFFPKAA